MHQCDNWFSPFSLRNNIVSPTLIIFFRLRYVKGTFTIFLWTYVSENTIKSVKNVNFVIKGGRCDCFFCSFKINNGWYRGAQKSSERKKEKYSEYFQTRFVRYRKFINEAHSNWKLVVDRLIVFCFGCMVFI